MNSQPALEHVSEVRTVRVKNRVEMGTIFGLLNIHPQAAG
jgi:hypothetical protein